MLSLRAAIIYLVILEPKSNLQSINFSSNKQYFTPFFNVFILLHIISKTIWMPLMCRYVVASAVRQCKLNRNRLKLQCSFTGSLRGKFARRMKLTRKSSQGNSGLGKLGTTMDAWCALSTMAWKFWCHR